MNGELVALERDSLRVGRPRTPSHLYRLLRKPPQPRRNLCAHRAVPPTVMRSSLTVGIPTPTGTLCPSLPQVPTPSSSSRSLPTIDTYLSASGPLPISIASRTGAVILPSSIRYASDAEKTNLPLVMSTDPPPKFTA